MGRKIRLTESKLNKIVEECVTELVNEGFFDKLGQKFREYHNGFPEGEAKTPEEFFEYNGWQIRAKQDSSKTPGAKLFALTRATGTFGAFNGLEPQELVEKFNKKFGGKLTLEYLRKHPKYSYVEVFKLTTQPQETEPAATI